jgi:hypothetical protein
MSGYNELETHGNGLQLNIKLLWRLLFWSGLFLHSEYGSLKAMFFTFL